MEDLSQLIYLLQYTNTLLTILIVIILLILLGKFYYSMLSRFAL